MQDTYASSPLLVESHFLRHFPRDGDGAVWLEKHPPEIRQVLIQINFILSESMLQVFYSQKFFPKIVLQNSTVFNQNGWLALVLETCHA